MTNTEKKSTYSESHKKSYERSKSNMYECECGTMIHRQRIWNHENRSQKHRVYMRIKMLKKIINDK